MTEDPVMHSVRELRAQGLSPSQIARRLGLRPATVSHLIRKLAAERDAQNPDTDLAGCWLNAGWSIGLGVPERADWRDPGTDESTGGLLTALVTRRRQHRHNITVCVYLVDVYCLGVKNAMGPDNMDEQALRRLTHHVFGGYSAPPVSAPINLVRDLVLGVAEYAHTLGFDPHPDFEQTRPHLGQWAGPSRITFGYNGKPTYISGPYDNPDRVLSTLRRTAGQKGFNYTIDVDSDKLPLAG
jgi:transcriptional regulator with XRE-family HTH domain